MDTLLPNLVAYIENVSHIRGTNSIASNADSGGLFEVNKAQKLWKRSAAVQPGTRTKL